ncbi:MAG: carbohydrate kinase [Cyclobacteriaceae bacterium]|nr:carbohydrate kinase [Cyclobacteriaceae bacterium]
MFSAICFGEVLWDIFPTYKNIGGAPLNVALRLQSFGINTYMISRIGNDENGNELLQYINENAVNTSNIQRDKIFKTGCVNVTLDNNGSAFYEIEYPVAWDKIEISDKVIETVKSSDVFIYGSLASRDEVSKSTLLNLLQYSNYNVFDVNLRAPYYSMDLLLSLMSKSDFIKCNDEELNEICVALNYNSDSTIEQIKFLSQHSQTQQICVTKGEHGADLFYKGRFYTNAGYPTKVADTVGAGDSFLATLIGKLLNNIAPDEALNYACAVGALVASKEGANPRLIDSEILALLSL